jgi:hypothetical protein
MCKGNIAVVVKQNMPTRLEKRTHDRSTYSLIPRHLAWQGGSTCLTQPHKMA